MAVGYLQNKTPGTTETNCMDIVFYVTGLVGISELVRYAASAIGRTEAILKSYTYLHNAIANKSSLPGMLATGLAGH